MDRPLSIVVVAACPFPYPRGTPIRCYRLAEALALMGLDVQVVTYHLGEDIGVKPFRVHRIPRIRTYNRTRPGGDVQKFLLVDPILALTLRRVLNRQHIDLIHAHHYEGLAVALMARHKARQPIVYDAHLLLESELPFYRAGLPRAVKQSIGRRIDRWLPRRADHVVCVSHYIREKLVSEGRLSPRRIDVVPSGVEVEIFEHLTPRRAGVRDKATLVFAGNLAAYQRIELLLRAFRDILITRPDTRLAIVTNSSFARYQRLATSLGVWPSIDVVPAEFERLPQLLARADVALNPRTDCSGTPQKLLNYMAAGVPVVSFAAAASIVRHGETGWIVEDGDVDSLHRGVLHLLDNPELARRLAVNAQNLVRNEFSWRRLGARVYEIYGTVLERQNIRRKACVHG